MFQDNHEFQIFKFSVSPLKMTIKDLKIHQADHRKVQRRKEDLIISNKPEKLPLYWGGGGKHTKKFIKEKLSRFLVKCTAQSVKRLEYVTGLKGN